MMIAYASRFGGGGHMAQKMFKAKITTSAMNSPTEVVVPAGDSFQARKVIEQMYGPIKIWYDSPKEIR